MTTTITVAQIEEGYIIDDGTDRVIVTEVWPDQGPGLGIMIKGRNIATARDWERRFLDSEDLVERVHGEAEDVQD